LIVDNNFAISTTSSPIKSNLDNEIIDHKIEIENNGTLDSIGYTEVKVYYIYIKIK
jgi:hypothetical protein